jgi:hypothetical protein
VPTPAYADGDVPTVAVGTDCADGIFSCADGYRPSAPCLRPVVLGHIGEFFLCVTSTYVKTKKYLRGYQAAVESRAVESSGVASGSMHAYSDR